ncbi:MAG: PAS domain S-box protein [Bacteroidetes bacterium]|nr:PAS domain S-box protein [Bacteroidota bacterium]
MNTRRHFSIQKTYLERLFNSAPEAIVWHDNLDRIVNVNDEFTRMFGYSREEAVGRPINDLLVPEWLKAEGIDFSKRVIGGERIDADTKRKRKDGSLVDVWVIGSPIARGGKQIGDYAIYRDITERKKAEEEILVQKTYLEKLFNSAPEGIVWHNNDDVVVNVNDEFTKMFGYSREEAVGKQINDLVTSSDFRKEAADISGRIRRGEWVELESKRNKKDGTVMDVSILCAPIIYSNKQIGDYAIYRDITERKRAEEARVRAETEARTARNIQVNFLPDSDPVIPGYAIAGRSIPA